jgi:hypothetical protein
LSALIVGASAAVLGTGIKAYEGLHQEAQANAIQKNLKDPTYNIPQEFYQNREIARQMAEQGLPQAVINNQNNRINQNQAAAIDAVSKSANPGTGIASVVRQGNAAGDTLAAEDAQARQNNQRYFIDQNKAVAGQELAKQQNDVFDKYTRNFNQMQAYRGAGMQNVNSEVNDVTQLGMMGVNYAAGQSTPTDPNYVNRANDPTLSGVDTMTGYGLPPLRTQLYQ